MILFYWEKTMDMLNLKLRSILKLIVVIILSGALFVVNSIGTPTLSLSAQESPQLCNEKDIVTRLPRPYYASQMRRFDNSPLAFIKGENWIKDSSGEMVRFTREYYFVDITQSDTSPYTINNFSLFSNPSPDGRYFITNFDGVLYSLRLADYQLFRLFPEDFDFNVGTYQFTPDSQFVVFSAYPKGQEYPDRSQKYLVSVPIEGDTPTILDQGIIDHSSFYYSPGGNTVYYRRYENTLVTPTITPIYLYQSPVDGSKPSEQVSEIAVSNSFHHAGFGVTSPSGKWLIEVIHSTSTIMRLSLDEGVITDVLEISIEASTIPNSLRIKTDIVYNRTEDSIFYIVSTNGNPSSDFGDGIGDLYRYDFPSATPHLLKQNVEGFIYNKATDKLVFSQLNESGSAMLHIADSDGGNDYLIGNATYQWRFGSDAIYFEEIKGDYHKLYRFNIASAKRELIFSIETNWLDTWILSPNHILIRDNDANDKLYLWQSGKIYELQCGTSSIYVLNHDKENGRIYYNNSTVPHIIYVLTLEQLSDID